MSILRPLFLFGCSHLDERGSLSYVEALKLKVKRCGEADGRPWRPHAYNVRQLDRPAPLGRTISAPEQKLDFERFNLKQKDQLEERLKDYVETTPGDPVNLYKPKGKLLEELRQEHGNEKKTLWSIRSIIELFRDDDSLKNELGLARDDEWRSPSNLRVLKKKLVDAGQLDPEYYSTFQECCRLIVKDLQEDKRDGFLKADFMEVIEKKMGLKLEDDFFNELLYSRVLDFDEEDSDFPVQPIATKAVTLSCNPTLDNIVDSIYILDPSLCKKSNELCRKFELARIESADDKAELEFMEKAAQDSLLALKKRIEEGFKTIKGLMSAARSGSVLFQSLYTEVENPEFANDDQAKLEDIKLWVHKFNTTPLCELTEKDSCMFLTPLCELTEKDSCMHELGNFEFTQIAKLEEFLEAVTESDSYEEFLETVRDPSTHTNTSAAIKNLLDDSVRSVIHPAKFATFILIRIERYRIESSLEWERHFQACQALEGWIKNRC